MKRMFTDQQERVIRNLSKIKASKKDVEAALLNEKREITEIVEVFVDPSITIAVQQAAETANLFGFFNVEVSNEEAKSYLNVWVKKFARETTQFTNEKLSKTLIEGLNDGDSVPDLKKRVEKVFIEARGYRAEMIARTELNRVSTWANEQVYKKAGVVFKEWLVNPGACQYCIPLDGTIIGINDSFLQDGQTAVGNAGGQLPVDYGNVKRPPLHPNCRCDLLPVL